ncbi:hypothetical protein SO694_00060051 [Aureococcus anophagefferens]|uniref:BEACH domain-containing protein n=1 Tax=Aureococcus anophagefferens TaxID=44056 RepID=A0ABR1FR04_AURAN
MVLTHEGLVAEINENWSFQDTAADEAAAARTHAQYRSVLKALMDRRSQGSCARRAALADRLATALAGDDEASRGALVFDGGASAGAELFPARAASAGGARARGTLLAWVREAKHCGRFEAFGVGRGGTRVVVTPGERDEGVAWSVEVFSGGKSSGVVERQIDDGDDADDGGAGHGADGTAPGLYAPRWRLLAVARARNTSARGGGAGTAPRVLRARRRAVCVRVKSPRADAAVAAELEPWYGVGSLVRLARCGYDTVELLALDAVGAVVLRRRSAASTGEFDGRGAARAAGFENSYDVDGRALAQLTALLGAREPRASPAAPRLGDRWARAASAASPRRARAALSDGADAAKAGDAAGALAALAARLDAAGAAGARRSSSSSTATSHGDRRRRRREPGAAARRLARPGDAKTNLSRRAAAALAAVAVSRGSRPLAPGARGATLPRRALDRGLAAAEADARLEAFGEPAPAGQVTWAVRADLGGCLANPSKAPRSHPARLLRRATRAWQERRLSNFGYLLVANALAGRSFADPCQYPVFPWVLADYSSEDLDLDDPRVYRDLAKPMGALNDARLRETVDRYEAFDDTYMPRFHYGSHYSTAAGVVVHYLLRTEPFGSLHCDLQGGRFDVADRLFASVAEAWDANSGARGEKSGSEVKELTPEWYCAPAFLTNRGRLPLGASQDGEAVGDVALPPWARGSPETFVRALRAALESDHASRHLHEWIDLVFGHKQRGPGAVDARNVFFYLCYADAVDVDAIEDPKLKAATILQASHFGQCPTQLLARRPHAPRGPPPAHHCRCLRVRESARRVDPRALALALEPGPDKLALARCASLLHNFRAGPVVALRATASRVVAVDAGGNVCALAWSYDAADEGNDEVARRVHLRPLAAPDELQSLKGGGFAGQATDSATDAAHLDRASGRAACGFGPLPARLCAISRDGTLVVAGGAYCGALRVSEFDLERGSDGAGPLCCAPVGEASVVAHDAALTLVVAFDDDAGVFARCEGERPDVLVRDLLSLAVVRSLTQHHSRRRAPPPAPRCSRPTATPAAVIVASDDGLLALRVFRGADAWADRRGAMHAGVSALVAKRATQVAGVIAGVLGRASDLSAATRDVVGEARASIKGSATFGKAMSLFRGSSSGS